jgi:hypothetical protein
MVNKKFLWGFKILAIVAVFVAFGFGFTNVANASGQGSEQPSIKVLCPQNNDILTIKSTQQIEWDFTGKPDSTVDIVLYKDNKVVRTIAYDVSIYDKAYTWNVGADLSTGDNFTIRFSSAKYDLYGANSKPFTIQ